ncbi:Na+/H+ antiporter subunit G [Pseudoxanthomonas suwonensis]
MSWIIAILLVFLLAAGAFFILVGSIGLVKFSEFFKRLHAPTKASTLGVGCVLLASVGYHWLGETDPQPRELLITAFLFITAPIGAHLMAKAALSLHMAERPAQPEGEPVGEGQGPDEDA